MPASAASQNSIDNRLPRPAAHQAHVGTPAWSMRLSRRLCASPCILKGGEK